MIASPYHIDVHYPGERMSRERCDLDSAQAVLDAIPTMLQAHSGCERLVVWVGPTRLFAVDCRGERLED